MYKLVFLTVAILSCCACKKDHTDDTAAAAQITVPPYTEIGANTVGCYINGKPWTNFGKLYYKSSTGTFPLFIPGSGGGGYYDNVVNPYLFKPSDGIGDSVLSISAELSVQKKGTTIRDETINLRIAKNGSFKGTHYLVSTNQSFQLLNMGGYYNYLSQINDPFVVTINKDSVTRTGRIFSGMFHGYIRHYVTGMPGQVTLLNDSLKIDGGVFDVNLKN